MAGEQQQRSFGGIEEKVIGPAEAAIDRDAKRNPPRGEETRHRPPDRLFAPHLPERVADHHRHQQQKPGDDVAQKKRVCVGHYAKLFQHWCRKKETSDGHRGFQQQGEGQNDEKHEVPHTLIVQ